MAPTCRRLLDHLKPQQLLGLTATPERGDGVDVAKQFFDGRTASELRLWDALDAISWFRSPTVHNRARAISCRRPTTL